MNRFGHLRILCMILLLAVVATVAAPDPADAQFRLRDPDLSSCNNGEPTDPEESHVVLGESGFDGFVEATPTDEDGAEAPRGWFDTLMDLLRRFGWFDASGEGRDS